MIRSPDEPISTILLKAYKMLEKNRGSRSCRDRKAIRI